ncbi:hypothetical protein [Sulfurimonas sp.]
MIFSACSQEEHIPPSKVKNQLKNYFQERFIKLECIGNTETFKLVNGDAYPKDVHLTFKAKVMIDGKVKTVVGSMQGLAGITTSGFGNWTSEPYIFFTFSLKKDWHFAKINEKVEYYCLGNHASSIEKIFNIFADEKPLKFTNYRTDFTPIRFSNEITIAEKMCSDGNEEYCNYYNDYINSRVRTAYNFKVGRKKVFNEFQKRYYRRLCEHNISAGCKELKNLDKQR